MAKTYNTPKRTHIVKTRLDDEEHADFLRRMEIYGMSQSEFIREAISGATIEPTIVATLVSDDLLAAVVSVGMCTDDGLMTWKVFLAEFLAKALCQIYVQSVVGYILGIKADDIVMAFDIFSFLIFTVTEVSTETGNRKIFVSAV